MLNCEAFRMITATPIFEAKTKKSEPKPKRKSPKAIGKIVASAVLAAITEYGPISVVDIASITHHSQAGIRSSISRMNGNDLFAIERRRGGTFRRDTAYYSIT